MKAVFLGQQPFNAIDESSFSELHKLSKESPNGVARYCLHASPDDAVQEMVIYMQANACTLPHRQRGKRKSYIVLRGDLCVLFFDDKGSVASKEVVTPAGEAGPTLLSFDSSSLHTTVCLGDDVIYVETITGPFEPDKTEWAHWITSKDNAAEVRRYLALLEAQDPRIAENWRSRPAIL